MTTDDALLTPIEYHSHISEMQGVTTSEVQKVQASFETLADQANKLVKELSGMTEQLNWNMHAPT